MKRLLHSLISDPAPQLVFELSADGVAAVRRDPRTGEVTARADRGLAEGALDPTPARSNVVQPQLLTAAVGGMLDELGPIRRPETAVLLPDSCSRTAVLDFEQLPAGAEERSQLIRLRLAKSAPFEIDGARLAYQTAKTPAGVTVLAVLTPAEIVRQYEDVFSRQGLWPGYVGLSLTAALNLAPDEGTVLFAKLSGRSLTLVALHEGTIRMLRSVELAPAAAGGEEHAIADMAADIYPTLVYVADQLEKPVEKILLCGFDGLAQAAQERFPTELGCEVEPLRRPDGPVGSRDAGLWGYLSLQ